MDGIPCGYTASVTISQAFAQNILIQSLVTKLHQERVFESRVPQAIPREVGIFWLAHQTIPVCVTNIDKQSGMLTIGRVSSPVTDDPV